MSAALRLVDELKIRLSEAQTKHHGLTEELECIKSEIEQLAKSEDNAKKAAEQSAAGLTILEGQLANAKDEIAQSTATRSQLASELQSLKDKAASEVIKSQQGLANQTRDYQALTERHSEQSQTVAAVRGELKGLQHSIATLQKQLTSNEQVTKQQKEQHERLSQQQRQEYERPTQQQKQEHDQQRQEYEEHKATLRERVEDLQELLRVERDAGVGRTQRTVHFRLNRQKLANEAAREQLRREMEHEQNQNIAALEASFQESRDSEQQMLREHAVALAEQHDIHEEVQIGFEAKMAEMKDSWKQEKDIMAQNHLQALAVKEDDHKKAVAALTSQWEDKLRSQQQSLQDKFKADHEAIAKAHEAKIEEQRLKLEESFQVRLNNSLPFRPGPSSWSAAASQRRRTKSLTGSPTQRQATNDSPVGDSSAEEQRDSSRSKRRRHQESPSSELEDSCLSNKRSRLSGNEMERRRSIGPLSESPSAEQRDSEFS
ncbi:hypothetical protein KCU88_g7352, partial [Aureobasidium melanogenum]